MTGARHELTMTTPPGRFKGITFGECSCGKWRSDVGLWERQNGIDDQLLEDYQVHRDVADEAERFESQRLDNAAGRAVNMGAK